MSIPTRTPDPYADNPVIDAAENALRAVGAISRERAEQLLARWAHTPPLSRRERDAVLARFGAQ